MKQRVQDLVRVGDSLFAKRYPILSLWQVQAENFHVMRADFTRARYLSEEFGSYLMTGRPARCHRDLKNAFSAMLRRGQWFHAKTDSELVNEDRESKIWLDRASKIMRLAMYDRRANFVRATKDADGDFCAFGNAVITRDIVDYAHFLFECWHLRDVAWDQDYKHQINTVHFDWKPQARQLQGMSRSPDFDISPKIAQLKREESFRDVKCRKIIVPSDEYDLPPQRTRNKPWVSVLVDCENEHVMQETPLRSFRVTIPRWETAGTMYGSQYGYSPPVVYGLPDGRMLQQMMLSMLEASEKATSPPLIAVGEAINGGVNLYASGITQTDADYDERTGDVLRPLNLQFEGIQFGAAQLERLEQALDDSFFLSKIRFPEISKDMTAYEASKLWDEFIRESLPLWEPVQQEYNAALCDGVFQDCLAMGKFGPFDEMPQALRGREVVWEFDTPITVAADRALKGAFDAMMQTLAEGAQVDPGVVMNADLDTATRDAIDGGGAPANWLRPIELVRQMKEQKQQEEQALAAAQAVTQGADTATRVANAAESAGNAARSLQAAGGL